MKRMANDKTMLFWIAAVVIVLAVAVPKSDWTFTAASVNPDVEPQYNLKFIDYPTTVEPGATFTYQVKIVNTGLSGILMVDSGIYAKQVIEGWGYPVSTLFAVFPENVAAKNINQCVESETNVQNKMVQLNKGDETIVTYKVTAPTDPCQTYYLHVGSFKKCWEPGDTEGAYRTSKVARTPVKITGTCKTTNATTTTKTTATGAKNETGTKSPSTDYLAEAKKAWNDVGTLGQVVVGIIIVLVVLFTVIPGKE